MIYAGDSQRQNWLERQKDFLSDWDEYLESTADGPFENSSSLKLPATLIVCKALHARFMQAILGTYPWVSVDARNEAYVAAQPVVVDVLQHYLDRGANYGKGTRRIIDQWLWKWITEGSAFLAQRWDCQYEQFMDVVTEYVPSIEVIDGKEVVVPKPKEVEKLVNKKVFEGPVWELAYAEDLVIIGGNGDIDTADSVHWVRSVNASELWGLADKDIFDKEAVEEVIESGPDWRPGLNSPNTDIKQQRNFNAGESQLWTVANLDNYKIRQSFLNMDVHGTGINSKVVVWSHERTGKVLGATYLRRINKDGLLPIQKIDFHIRPGEKYGVSVPEIMHPLQTEITAMHNMRIDNGILTTMPFGFYRATSSIQPQPIQMKPGMLMPTDDPQRDIYFPQFNNRTAFGGQEEQNLWGWIEKLFGVSDLTLGSMSGSQGATRTASGVQALQGESNINLNVPLARLNEGWTRALNYMLTTLQRRIPEGLSFKVSGDTASDYWRVIRSSDDIAGEFDINVSANTADSNKMIQQQNADTILQIASNPLYIQLGIASASNIYEAVRNSLRQRGVKNYSQFITKPKDYSIILAPGDEINRIIAGQEVPIDLRQDHQGYLDLFQKIHDSDELIGALNQQQVIALAQQAQKHKQAMSALAAQQAQQANVAQMQQNQAMSAQAAPQPAPQAPPPAAPQGGGIPGAQ